MNHLNLIDNAEISGKDILQLEEILKEIDKNRDYVVIQPEELKFFVLDQYTPDTKTGVMLPPYMKPTQKEYQRRYVPLDILKLPEDLRKESIDCGVFFKMPDGGVYPVSANALDDLQQRVGIRGAATEAKTPALMEFLIESVKNSFDQVTYDGTDFSLIKNGKSQKEKYIKAKQNVANNKKFSLTVVFLKDHENQNIRKVFSFRSEKYVPIPQTNIIECIHQMQMMGKPQLRCWKVNHFFTDVDVTFPDVAEEFANVFNLRNKYIPCFRVNTSDTGRSSLRISKYLVLENSGKEVALRLPESEQEKRYELTKHIGKTDIHDLVAKINSNLFHTFKKVPELMGQIMFLGEAPVKETLKIAFDAMKLQKHAGVLISQDLQEKVIEQLAAMLPPVQKIMDTVYAALFAADEENLTLSDNQREALRDNALLSVFPIDKYRELEIKAVKAAV